MISKNIAINLFIGKSIKIVISPIVKTQPIKQKLIFLAIVSLIIYCLTMGKLTTTIVKIESTAISKVIADIKGKVLLYATGTKLSVSETAKYSINILHHGFENNNKKHQS
jgi:hypothetical protein